MKIARRTLLAGFFSLAALGPLRILKAAKEVTVIEFYQPDFYGHVLHEVYLPNIQNTLLTGNTLIRCIEGIPVERIDPMKFLYPIEHRPAP